MMGGQGNFLLCLCKIGIWKVCCVGSLHGTGRIRFHQGECQGVCRICAVRVGMFVMESFKGEELSWGHGAFQFHFCDVEMFNAILFARNQFASLLISIFILVMSSGRLLPEIKPDV